jgi:RNA-directed DNA polymerase
MSKNILSYNYLEIREFFLKEKSYVNFDLPPYFQFSGLLKIISEKLYDKEKSDYKTLRDYFIIDKNIRPGNYDNTNYKLITNKDGFYAWRPLEIIHPVLYVDLVNTVTNYKNWKDIKKRIGRLRSKSKVKCLSWQPKSVPRKKDKGNQILDWWKKLELESIKKSLEFKYMFEVDISNCYPSIYTHSISWALRGKNWAKQNRHNKNSLGAKIDKSLQNMSHGQTNGIPQGSNLMDFIAELILNYSDAELSSKIKEIRDFSILRYRDDYRIFTNSIEDGELILKNLTNVLREFGMSLNSKKTKISDNIILSSIKEDKNYFITSTLESKNLLHELYIINEISLKYPNSGSVIRKLSYFHKRILKSKTLKVDAEVLISLVVDIMIRNPKILPTGSAILSKLFSFVSRIKQENIIKLIRNKFSKIPNTGYLDIWLQRFTIKLDTNIDYEETLCKKINNPKIELWNSDWLNTSFKNTIEKFDIIDREELKNIDQFIQPDEIDPFSYQSL